MKKLLLILFLMITCIPLKAQNDFQGLESFFTAPNSYVVKYTGQVLKIDGNLQEHSWEKALWTTEFVDIEGDKKQLPPLKTQVKMLWNDSTLFIAAKLQEPQVWAYQTHHDDVIFKDNDFEIFIDPDNNVHDYFEIEINALNKVFDLFLSKPYRNGGDGLIGWDIAGLKSAIKVEGTLNNPKDKDNGWVLEMAIPLKKLRMGYPFHAPEEGDIWRINFSRVEWDTETVNGKNVKIKDAKGKELPEHNWVWSPQGLINMHFPERWGYLQFSKKENINFKLPYNEQQKRHLWLIYYRQKQHHEKFGTYANALTELTIGSIQNIEGRENQLKMQATDHQFTASVNDLKGNEVTINEEGLIHYKNKKP